MKKPIDHATRILALRSRLRLSQAELGARLGVSYVTINRWENGHFKPTRSIWQRVLQLEHHTSDIQHRKAVRKTDMVELSLGAWTQANMKGVTLTLMDADSNRLLAIDLTHEQLGKLVAHRDAIGVIAWVPK